MTVSSPARSPVLAAAGGRLPLLVPGLLLATALALSALAAGRQPAMATHGIGALTLAIGGGILLGNTLPDRFLARLEPGAAIARQHVLRLGIVLYGLRLTFHDLARIGLAGVLVDAAVVATTLALSAWIGIRWLRLDRQTALLVGTGSAICGAAAVMAATPVVRGRDDQASVAVATVVVFGTAAMFAWPALYTLATGDGWLAMSAERYGLFAGSTVHEVAHAYAAGHAVSEAAADTAVMAKMARVMMLAPVLLVLSWLQARRTAAMPGADGRARIIVPRFAFAFLAVVACNSLAPLPAALAAAVSTLDTLLLATAMAALGLGTRAAAMRKAGLRPLLLALLLFAWLLGGGLAINLGVDALVRPSP